LTHTDANAIKESGGRVLDAEHHKNLALLPHVVVTDNNW